jgi:predicted transcriptional regulator
VVHTRANITAMNLETFRQILEGCHLPSALVKKGGIYVTISADKLKSAREAQNLSAGRCGHGSRSVSTGGIRV